MGQFLRRDAAIRRYKGRFGGLGDALGDVQTNLMGRFESSERIGHNGDRGEEREIFLKHFLNSAHVPKRYAVVKGHANILNRSGRFSEQADLVLYDANSCALLRDGENHSYLPIESVYAAIQVKSRLSKKELVKSADNIASVKRLSWHGPVTRRRTNYSGATHAEGDFNPIPLGVIFAYDLADNSLESLRENILEYCGRTDPIEWPNIVCVLNSGIIYRSGGLDSPWLIDSRDLICSPRTSQSLVARDSGGRTLLDFYLALMGGLGMLELMPPPLHAYVDLPMVSATGVAYQVDLAAIECPTHGPHEVVLREEWATALAAFVSADDTILYPPATLLGAILGSPETRQAPILMDQHYGPGVVYAPGVSDPLSLLKMRFESGRPTLPYLQVIIEGVRVIVPECFVDGHEGLPEIFRACPECKS